MDYWVLGVAGLDDALRRLAARLLLNLLLYLKAQPGILVVAQFQPALFSGCVRIQPLGQSRV